MHTEIERKFLVKGEFKHLADKSYRISQGYLSSVAERTVRVRIKNDKGYITVKGKSNASGTSRFEWEKEIEYTDACRLLELCEQGVIDKTRYEIVVGNKIFEVDEFHGSNEGLIVAEIELASEDEIFEKPDWLGQEVTGNKHYYNSWISKNPFTKWEK